MNDKTVVRAGGGRFFTRLGVSDSVFLGGNPPFQPTANVSFGSADNPGGISANSLPLTVTTQSRDFKNPEAWNWNFTVERELPFNSTVSVGYVGRRGLHLQRESNINQPTPDVVAANPGVRTSTPCGRTRATTRSARPTTLPVRMYNGLQLSLNRRFSKACIVRAGLHLQQGHGRWVQPARHHPRHLLRSQSVGTGGVRYAARVHRQLPVRAAVLQGQQPRCRASSSAAGRSAA